MADAAKMRSAISEILDEADLDTITAKKVRQQLEAKLKTDLTERKKEIDQMVMEILEEKQDQDKSEEEEAESEDEKKKSRSSGGGKRKKHSSESEDDYVPEKKGKKGKKAADSDDDASDVDWGRRRRAAAPKPKTKAGGGKKRGGGGGGNGYTKPLKLSPQLSSVMGQAEMPRHEVVKKIWSIIKEKNLYDPKNRQFAICNEELLPVFGVKRFRTFGMMKHLKDHFFAD